MTNKTKELGDEITKKIQDVRNKLGYPLPEEFKNKMMNVLKVGGTEILIY